MDEPADDEKVKPQGLSMKPSEVAELDRRMAAAGFSSRRHYVLALLEAEESLRLRPVLDSENKRILRPLPAARKILDDEKRRRAGGSPQ